MEATTISRKYTNVTPGYGVGGDLGYGNGPWGVGEPIPEGTATTGEAMEAAGLDWSVKLDDLYVKDPEKDDNGTWYAKLENNRAVVREDTGKVLGVVGSRFKPLQNEDAFAMFDDLFEQEEARFVSATSIGGGRRVALIAEMPGDLLVGGSEEEHVKRLLLLAHGHDGSLAITLKRLPVRFTCWNALAMVLRKSTPLTFTIKHTERSLERLVHDAKLSLQQSKDYFEQFGFAADRMLRQHWTTRQFEGFVEQLVPMPIKAIQRIAQGEDGGRAAKNVEERREAIRAIHANSPNLQNIKGTKWGAFNAVTEYADWHKPVRTTKLHTAEERRFVRATGPDALKSRAWKMLTEAA